MKSKLVVFVVIICFTYTMLPTLAQNTVNPELSPEHQALKALGLWKDEYSTEGAVTRAEYAHVITDLFLDEAFVQGNTRKSYYNDVALGSAHLKYINAATDAGYMKGVSEKTFTPDRAITLEQAFITLMRALGYGDISDNTGGYAFGYYNQSVSRDILRGIQDYVNMPLSSSLLSKLIFNSMFVPVMDVVGTGNGIKYSNDTKRTMLSMRDVYHDTGIVTGNDITMLAGSSKLNKGCVMIGNTVYQEGSSGAGKFLGHFVEVFVHKNQNDNTGRILHAYNAEKWNEVEVITSDDLVSFDFLSREYTYLDASGKNQITSFTVDADIIFNGKASAIDSEDFLPNSGNITLIDNSKNGRYNVVIIQSYKQCFVNRVDVDNGVIYDADESFLNIELSAGQPDYRHFIYDINGQTHNLAGIHSNDVVSVAVSSDGKYHEVILHRENKKGTLEMLNKDEGELVIDGESYFLAHRAKNLKSKLKPGDFISVYLDFTGKVAGIKTEASTSNLFGYLIAMNSKPGLNSNIEFKIFNQNGEFVIKQAVRNIEIDGVTYKTNEYAKVENAVKTNSNVNQLIHYSLRSDGTLLMVDTAKNTPAEAGRDSLYENPYVKADYYPQGGLSRGETGSMSYIQDTSSFSYRVFLDDNTTLFYIPFSDLSEESAYKVGHVSSLSDGYESIIEAYSLGADYRLSDVIVMEAVFAPSSYGPESNLGVVVRITDTVDNDGNIFKNLHTITASGDEIVILKNPSSSNPTLVIENKVYAQTYASGGAVSRNVVVKPGDTVRYLTDPSNTAYSIQMILDSDTREFYNPTANSAMRTRTRITGGYIDEYSKGLLSVKNGNLYSQLHQGVSLYEHYKDNACPVIIVDFYNHGKKQFVRSGKASEIKDYKSFGDGASWIIFHTDTGSPKVLIVYNGLETVTNPTGGYSEDKPLIGFVYPY
ncbi:MAG: S-layer homology domain-containing protein [Firmicutes bacterium]|nr:S-layer homology domain-containing protein [Bacillota bacterium]